MDLRDVSASLLDRGDYDDVSVWWWFCEPLIFVIIITMIMMTMTMRRKMATFRFCEKQPQMCRQDLLLHSTAFLPLSMIMMMITLTLMTMMIFRFFYPKLNKSPGRYYNFCNIQLSTRCICAWVSEQAIESKQEIEIKIYKESKQPWCINGCHVLPPSSKFDWSQSIQETIVQITPIYNIM